MQSENFRIEKLKMQIGVDSELMKKREMVIDLRKEDLSSVKMAENNLKRRAKLFDDKLFKAKF